MPLNNLGKKMIKQLTKITLISTLLFSTVLNADIVKENTLACPSIEQLKKAPLNTKKNSLDLSMYAISNNCIILTKRDKVEAIGSLDDDIRNSKEIYQKIMYKKTGVILYMKRSALGIEKGGKKASYRF